MIDPNHELSVKRQAEVLGISRASVYYVARGVSERDLALMRHIDELHLEHPFAGSRMLRDLLKHQGSEVGRKQVATLMRRMGIEALYRKPHLSQPHPEHRMFPYRLRGLAIEPTPSDRGRRLYSLTQFTLVRLTKRGKPPTVI
jgi:putative transposase